MALVSCPKCGENISNRAEVCIHCGAVLKGGLQTENTVPYTHTVNNVELVRNNADVNNSSKKGKIIIPIVIAATVILLIVGIICFLMKKPKIDNKEKDANQITEVVKVEEPRVEEKTKEVSHKKTIAEWSQALSHTDEYWSIQTSLKEDENGEVSGDVKFKFYSEALYNVTLDDPEVKKACLDSMDDYMFAIKTDLAADNYTIGKITGTSSQYNKTITIQ